MKQINIKNIVFDLGGVLIDWDPRYVFKEIFSTSEQVEEFLRNVCNNEWNARLDKGLPFTEGVAELKSKFPEFSKEIEIYEKRWEDMINGAINSTVEVLQRLHTEKKYRLFGLSNWAVETFPIAEKRFPFLKSFEHIVVSGRVKMIKPDEEIFKHLLEKAGIVSGETIFIDDVLANIQTAQRLGFQTIHFDRKMNLATELRKFNVEL